MEVSSFGTHRLDSTSFHVGLRNVVRISGTGQIGGGELLCFGLIFS
jgi:hypothetical protein